MNGNPFTEVFSVARPCWKCGGLHKGGLCPTFDRPQQIISPIPAYLNPAPLSDSDVDRIARRLKELMEQKDV